MATSKSLAKPKILAVDGSVIRIQHPDVNNYVRTYLSAQIAAAGTAMSVLDNNGFADNDWMVVGEVGDEKTETTDVNGAVTRGTAMTVTNALSFAHELDAPVTRILERGIKIYGAATDGGSGTLIASIDALTASGRQLADAKMIEWNKPYTEHNFVAGVDTTDYDYFYVTFTDGTTESSASDYIASTGLGSTSAEAMIQGALDITGAQPSESGEVTWPFLIRSVQDWQDYVTQWVDTQSGIKKDWSWEYISDNTSLTLTTYENRYALSGLSSDLKYNESKQGVLNLILGKYPTQYIPIDKFDRELEGRTFTQVATAASAGGITLVVDDITMFTDPDGESAAFTAVAGTDVCTSAGHTLSDGDTVTLSSTTTLPGGLAVDTTYYIIDSATNTFKLSTTLGGSAVDITDTGTGTHYFQETTGTGTIYCGGNAITYTAIDTTTDTFSGIPASGTGAITTAITVGATCWQENISGRPSYWTIYNGYLLFTIPPESTYSGWPIKVKYIKKLTAITEISDTTEIPFYNSCQYYVAYKIELKRGNTDAAQSHLDRCENIVSRNARSDKSYTTETFKYYDFDGRTSRDQDWNSDTYSL